MENIFEEEVQTAQPDTEKFWTDVSDEISGEEVDLAPLQKDGLLMTEEPIYPKNLS